MNAKEAARDEARAKLREWIKPGDTVYTILRHVARSGMSRDVSVVVFLPSGPIWPNYAVHEATGYRLKRGGMHDAITMQGCGYDAGDSLVADLGFYLYGEGHGLRQRWL